MDWQLETTVSDEQVEFYKDNGYLTFGRIFTKAELDTLRDYVDEMIEKLARRETPRTDGRAAF